MRTVTAFVDPFGLLVAAITGIAVFAILEGPLVAVLAAMSVVVVRIAAGLIAADRLRPSAIARPGLRGSWYGPLTKTEAEIALLVADGLSDKEIAERRDRSERTIETHIFNANIKLTKHTGTPFHNRTQTAVWITEQQRRMQKGTLSTATSKNSVRN